MSRVPKDTSHALAEEVRMFLEAHFGTPPNLYKAATELGEHEPEGSDWNRDRTLLRRVALKRDEAGKYSRQLNLKSAERLIALVAIRDSRLAERLTALLWDQGQVRAFRRAIADQDGEWYAPLSSLDLDIVLRPSDLSDRTNPTPDSDLPHSFTDTEWRFFQRIAERSLPAIKADASKGVQPHGSVADQIERFETWARKHGHSKWVVRGALQRALAPLASADRTGGLFLAWEELTLRERRRFLYHALARERIALGEVSAEHRTVRGVLEARRVTPAVEERTTPVTRTIEVLLEREKDRPTIRPKILRVLGTSRKSKT